MKVFEIHIPQDLYELMVCGSTLMDDYWSATSKSLLVR